MHRLKQGAALCLSVAVFAIASAGCSRDAKRNRHLNKASEYFAAGEYDKAEIEFKNASQFTLLDPKALAGLGIIYFDQGRIPFSRWYLEKAVELDPENVDARLKMGFLQLAGGKRDDARETANFVLQKRPTDAEALLLLVESIAQPADAPQARAILEQLAQKGTSAPVLAALGALSIKERKFTAAETQLAEAVRADPKLAITYSILGGLYLAQKDSAKAENSFAKAAELAPPRSIIRLQWVYFNLQNGKADVAKRTLDDTMRNAPDFLTPYILRANIAFAEKQYDESLALLERAFQRDAVHPEGLLLAAQVRMAKGEPDKAVTTLIKAAERYSTSPQMHHQLGTAYLSKGDLANAANSFSQAIKVSAEAGHDYAPSVLALANVNIRQRSFEAATNLLKPFLQRNPANGDAQLLLAETYRRVGSMDPALAIYRQLAVSNPKNAQLQALMGSVFLQQNKKAEARQAFAKAVELSPEFVPALEQLVNLDIAEKQFSAAEARLLAAITKTPGSPAAHLLLAQFYLNQNQGDKAESALKKVIELQPESPAGYLLLGQLYLNGKQAEKALENFQKVIVKDPNNFGALTMVGVLQESQKDFKAARVSYEKALAINSKSQAVLNNLAYMLAEQTGEFDKALEYAQRSHELAPDQAEATDTLGWVFFRKGQHARAAALLEESGEKLPDNAEARFHQGMARYMVGDEPGARSALERALQLNPSFQGAEEARQSLAILTTDLASGSEAARKPLFLALERRKDDPIALAKLAATYERDGAADKALSAYESVLKSNPANVTAALNAIRLYRAQKQPAKALELARSTRKLAPSDGRVVHVLGRLSFENGENLFAVGALREAARLQQDEPEVMFDLAEALYSVGQLAAAEAAFRDALRANSNFSRAPKAREYAELIPLAQDPTQASAAQDKISAALKSDASNVPALMAQAAIDEKKPDIKAAKQGNEKALARFPDFTPAKRNLAILYSLQPEDDKKAIEYATKAREAFPSDPDLAKAFGILQFRQGNYARAVSLLEESARVRTNDAEVQYYLGLAQFQLKNPAGSKRYLERALQLGLSDKLAADARRVLAAN